MNNSRKNNLVVIITPYLIPKTKDITFVRNKLSELKNLEDKYLENSLINLKEKSLVKNNDSEKNKKNDDNKLNHEKEFLRF